MRHPPRERHLRRLVHREEQRVSRHLSRERRGHPAGHAEDAVLGHHVSHRVSRSSKLPILDAALYQIRGGHDQGQERSAERPRGGALREVTRHRSPTLADDVLGSRGGGCGGSGGGDERIVALEPAAALVERGVVDAGLDAVADEGRGEPAEEPERPARAAAYLRRHLQRRPGRMRRPRLHRNLDRVEGVGADGVRDSGDRAARHVHRDGRVGGGGRRRSRRRRWSGRGRIRVGAIAHRAAATAERRERAMVVVVDASDFRTRQKIRRGWLVVSRFRSRKLRDFRDTNKGRRHCLEARRTHAPDRRSRRRPRRDNSRRSRATAGYHRRGYIDATSVSHEDTRGHVDR